MQFIMEWQQFGCILQGYLHSVHGLLTMILRAAELKSPHLVKSKDYLACSKFINFTFDNSDIFFIFSWFEFLQFQ
jgi:hypothetical protein